MSTIAEVLAPFIAREASDDQLDWTEVEVALQQREDKIREDLSMIAAQLGTFPELVAEAFADVGLGTPPTPEVREMLHRQYHERMEWLAEQIRRANGE